MMEIIKKDFFLIGCLNFFSNICMYYLLVVDRACTWALKSTTFIYLFSRLYHLLLTLLFAYLCYVEERRVSSIFL